jgi:hypothetical protein
MSKHIIGATDEQTVCDMCGRTELKLTVIVGDEDGYETGRYGTSCVDIVLNNGKRRTTAAQVREIEECRKGEIYTRLYHFDADYRVDVRGQRRMNAMTMLNDAIKAHNKLPVPTTRKAIHARLDVLKAAGSPNEPLMRARVL